MSSLDRMNRIELEKQLDRLKPWLPFSRLFVLLCFGAAVFCSLNGEVATGVMLMMPGLMTWIAMKQYWTYRVVLKLLDEAKVSD